MSDDREPLRLLDPDATASEPLRAALEAGRADLPDAAHLARLAARLPLGGPPPPPDAPPPPQAPLAPLAPAAAPSALGGAVAGAALAVAVIGGAWWHEVAKQPISPAPIVAAANTAPTGAAPHAARPLPISPSAPPDIAPSATSMLPSAMSPVVRAPVASAAAQAPSVAEPPPSAAVALSASPPPPAAEGESEVALLQRAQDALGKSAARALAVTMEHEQRFPRGSLSQEREVIAITALAALGRTGDARARAAAFLARFPESAHRSRLLSIVPSLADTPPSSGEAR
ncbi:Outer membrane protein, OmpA/MotB family protein [Minicystis rosea]|nr:Outer membrane protein, OmpA/MotB family protein [Minicystis rosea]